MMTENLRRITVKEYHATQYDYDDERVFVLALVVGKWIEILDVERYLGFNNLYRLSLMEEEGIIHLSGTDALYIECGAEEALADDRERIGRNLAYWRQLRLSAMRQQEHGVQLIPSPTWNLLWQSAYNRSVWWEDALTRLEAEHAGDK